jgi:site-specific recombinase XerD
MEREIKEYLGWKGTYASRAAVSYKIWLDRFIEVCGNRPINSYSINDVVKFKNWLEEHYSSASTQMALVVLKNFFAFFKDQNFDCLPSRLIRLPKKINKSYKHIGEDEFKTIIGRIATDSFSGLRDNLIIRLLWDTGIRVSELCDLDTTQFDVTRNCSVIHSKKSNVPRTIMWSGDTHLVLLNYLSQRMTQTSQKDCTALFIGFLKGRGWSKRLTKRSVERIVKKYLHLAGILHNLSPHSFRHGWAHKRRDQNAPLSFIQKGLGHTSPISTFVYEQYNDKEFEENARKYLTVA